MASATNCVLLIWNVRGLNNPARRQVVKELIANHRCKLVSLQETKLQTMDDATIATTLGHEFVSGCATLPAQGT
jgi:exonuclease III